MPGFDGTGPMGLGPLTGRGMGYCAVQLPPSETEGEPYLSTSLVSAGTGVLYPHQGMACPQGPLLNQFVPGLFHFGMGCGRGFRFGRALGPRWVLFGR
jgi:hypothetical protein